MKFQYRTSPKSHCSWQEALAAEEVCLSRLLRNLQVRTPALLDQQVVQHPLDHKFASLSYLEFDLAGPAVVESAAAERMGCIAGTAELATLLVIRARLAGLSCIVGCLLADGSFLFAGFQLLAEAVIKSVVVACIIEFDRPE